MRNRGSLLETILVSFLRYPQPVSALIGSMYLALPFFTSPCKPQYIRDFWGTTTVTELPKDELVVPMNFFGRKPLLPPRLKEGVATERNGGIWYEGKA